MKENSKTKKVRLAILTMVMIAGMMLASGTNVQAVLQANYSTHTQSSKLVKKGSEWISEIRGMEARGGTMGLEEEIDGTSLLTKTGTASNNIDVHMMKTTEWGAIEILAASDYGSGSSGQVDNKTTTNDTGVFFDGVTWEWTAGVGQDLTCNGRYYDKYSPDKTNGPTMTSIAGGPKAGDGLGAPTLNGADQYPGCAGWTTKDKTSSLSDWLSNASYGFKRGNYGLFSFSYGSWTGGIGTCRGVAVVGAGL